MKHSRYIIRDREAGNVIDSFDTPDEAKNELMKFEKADKKEGVYIPDFYELWDSVEETEAQRKELSGYNCEILVSRSQLAPELKKTVIFTPKN